MSITKKTCLCESLHQYIYCFISSLTRAVGVDRETLVDVVLDEQKCLFKDLPCTRLLHCVRVTWIPEKSEQLSRGTRLTGVMTNKETGC